MAGRWLLMTIIGEIVFAFSKLRKSVDELFSHLARAC